MSKLVHESADILEKGIECNSGHFCKCFVIFATEKHEQEPLYVISHFLI